MKLGIKYSCEPFRLVYFKICLKYTNGLANKEVDWILAIGVWDIF